MDAFESDRLSDERMLYRIRKIEAEKEKQIKKHQQKIEQTDWLSKLNEKEKENGHQ